MFTSIIANTEKTRLINGFPLSVRQDVEEVIKILPFDHHVLLADGNIRNLDCLVHPREQTVLLNGELLNIPCRIYFNEPQAEKEKLLTALQKIILNCIYLLHHNGFVRQRRLEQLIDSTEKFVIPYTFHLLGEYVMEILQVLDKHVNAKTIDIYGKFIKENKHYWQQTEDRMISYWNEYYRRTKYPKLKDYIGKKIIDRIKANAQQASLA